MPHPHRHHHRRDHRLRRRLHRRSARIEDRRFTPRLERLALRRAWHGQHLQLLEVRQVFERALDEGDAIAVYAMLGTLAIGDRPRRQAARAWALEARERLDVAWQPPLVARSIDEAFQLIEERAERLAEEGAAQPPQRTLDDLIAEARAEVSLHPRRSADPAVIDMNRTMVFSAYIGLLRFAVLLAGRDDYRPELARANREWLGGHTRRGPRPRTWAPRGQAGTDGSSG